MSEKVDQSLILIASLQKRLNEADRRSLANTKKFWLWSSLGTVATGVGTFGLAVAANKGVTVHNSLALDVSVATQGAFAVLSFVAAADRRAQSTEASHEVTMLQGVLVQHELQNPGVLAAAAAHAAVEAATEQVSAQ